MHVAATASNIRFSAVKLLYLVISGRHWNRICLLQCVLSRGFGALGPGSATSAETKHSPQTETSSSHLVSETGNVMDCSFALSIVLMSNLFEFAAKSEIQVLNLPDAQR
mmetsp:Transcript_35542/g.62747  ORF Transcript_35542/g.62747 Transcript_35542/m.62747 type:complete len:109 (-) Transcript_35542:587-913(-)